MDQHTKRLAAAAYDRGRDAPRTAEDRTTFVSVELESGTRRTVLCDVSLPGDPPESLSLAVAETLAVLRVTWIAMLQERDGIGQRRLDAAHAAIQCELATAEWTWSSGHADARALARTLTARRERHRRALAMPAPHGVGLLVPGRARAAEPLPRELEEEHQPLLRAAAAANRSRREWLEEASYAAIGAWRLGEVEVAVAAAAIAWLLGRDTDELRPVPAASARVPSPDAPPVSEPHPALRVAS
jgi:hypothetical protein